MWTFSNLQYTCSSFMDDYSCCAYIPVDNKSRAPLIFRISKAEVRESNLRRTVRLWSRTLVENIMANMRKHDSIWGPFRKILERLELCHNIQCTLEQNGVEKLNHTLIWLEVCGRCLLQLFWDEVFQTAIYVINGMGFILNPSTTPFEFGIENPNLSHLYVWGNLAEARNNNRTEETVTVWCYFTGYPLWSKGNGFNCPSQGKKCWVFLWKLSWEW